MPNRIIKESICRSEEINGLSWFEEVLFYRLMVVCDDYGRYDGRAAIIKGACFPLKDVTAKDIEKALDKLSAVGLVVHYKVEEKPYLQLVTWEKHQQIRAKKSKYPPCENICNHLISNVPVIQSESESNRNNIVATLPESATAAFPDDSFEIQCVDMIIDSCLKTFPSSKVPGTFSEKQKWALEIDRMKRLDGRSEADIMCALRYAVTDAFWQTNIRSTKKFREKFETLIAQSKGKRRNAKDFNGFQQNQYDFNQLEQELLSN